MITPKRIKDTPLTIRSVKCSLKKINPKNIAVIGSKAPSMAVFVEPINFIAMFIVSIEIIVGKIAKPKTHNHKNGLCNICNSVQNLRLKT